jgi:hypothetical protein
VLAASGEAVWSELVVGSVECMIDSTVVCAHDDGPVVCALAEGTVVCAVDDGIVVCALDAGTGMCALNDGTVICALDDGTMICAHNDALCLFFFLKVDFVVILRTAEVSAVAGDMI